MKKDADCIRFYRDAVMAGHDLPAAETMRRFNLSRGLYCSSTERGHRTMRWSRYPQLESSAVEDASGLGRIGDQADADSYQKTDRLAAWLVHHTKTWAT